MHFNNIYHRDIKGNNIMLTENFNQYKIIDFGISKEIKDDIIEIMFKPPEVNYDYRF